MRPVRRSLTATVVFLSGIVVFGGGATPAWAHPDDVPQQLEVRAEGNEIEVLWSASPHDLSALAHELGLVDELRSFVWTDGGFSDEESDLNDFELLAANQDVLGAYLLESISARIGGEACEGSFHGAPEIAVGGGARLTFACPGPLEQVELSSTALTDLGPGYEAEIVMTDIEQRPTFTEDEPTLLVEFDGDGTVAAAAPPGTFDPTIPIIAAALAVAVGAVVLLWRRHRRAA